MTRYAYERNGVIYTFGEDDEAPPQPVGTFEDGWLLVTHPLYEDALEDEAHELNADFDRVPFLPADDDFLPLGKVQG